MAKLSTKNITDYINGAYKKVKKYVVEYTYENEPFTHYYDDEKKAQEHLSNLKAWGI